MGGQVIRADVAIIGAGPAGLTTAWQLTKQGVSVVLIEKDPRYVGGISRTVEQGGYRFDIGGHRFFSKSKEVTDLWNEILPDDFIERPRMSRIYYEGKFYSYPLRAFEALRNLGLWRSTTCMASFLWWKAFPHRDVKSFEQWVTNAFGRRLFSIFFKTYTEKVWGMGCDEMSADWAAQRIKGLSLGKAVLDGVKRSLGLNRRPNDGMATKSLLESFRYPRRGPGMMWEAARDGVVARGGRILMGHALQRLSCEDGVWRVVAKGPDGPVTIEAGHVVSSAPLRELASRLHPLPATAPKAWNLRYRDFLTVALMIRADDMFPDNWIYIHDPRVQVGRIQNFRSWSPEMVPDADVACVGLEYFCFEGDGLWSATDDELVALATREMAQLGLADPATVEGGVVVRQEKAYPVYDETYAQVVSAVRTELEAAYPTLHMVGRNGMHRYNNQDHAMMTAMLAAENIVAGHRRHDLWQVNEDAEYHEEVADGDRAAAPLTEGQRAALASVRQVPEKLQAAA